VQITKRQFARDVLHIIQELCRVIYNLETTKDIERIFGISGEQLETVINKIVNALPDDLFTEENKSRIKEIEQILAKEFIFFQVQERVDDPAYQTDLANFILIFSKDIHTKLQLWKEEQLK
jgi:hypothetical protein